LEAFDRTPGPREIATQLNSEILMNSEILTTIRNLAQSEGRRRPSLVDEALADLIETRRQNRPRANVMAAYQASHEKFGALYKKLAE
jgi:hypothetical protein